MSRDETHHPSNPILIEIGRRHKIFWADQDKLLKERLADPAICQLALEALRKQSSRGIPVRFQKCFYEVFADAAEADRHFLTYRARAAGRSRKADPLQKLIESIVQARPKITHKELLGELRNRQMARHVIDDIDEIEIAFMEGAKTAPISGLKDRLSRAKKRFSR